MADSSHPHHTEDLSGQDAVTEAFERTRSFSQEHGGAPQLGTPPPARRRHSWVDYSWRTAQDSGQAHAHNPVQNRRPDPTQDPSLDSSSASQNVVPSRFGRRRGIPTGKDGRALPRSVEMTSIAKVWAREVTARGWAPHLIAADLMSHWDDVVGSQVASHSRVTQVEDSIATIICDSDSWATNLRYFQSHILTRIADKFGDQIICELRIYGPSHDTAGSAHRYRSRRSRGRR